MNLKSEKFYDFNKIAKNYENSKIGLRKEVVNFEFQTMIKATEISRCSVLVSDVHNLNSRETNYLNKKNNEIFWIEMGSGVTPIDYYIEIFLQEMFENETSKCYIKTKSDEEISFKIKIVEIDFKGYIYELNLKDIFELAKRYKENGVAMFKKYPKFAHEYFCRGAKCLLSYTPFEGLTENQDGVDPEDLNKLLHNLQLNISACLLKEKRYEDVVHLTCFVEKVSDNVEKAIYRRAFALYSLKNFEEARNVILKLKNYRQNLELSNLYTNILNEMKNDNEHYKDVVRKMFG